MRHGSWFFDCNLSPNESTLFKAARLIFLKRERLLILQNYHPSSRCFHDFPPWSSKIGTLKCPGKSGHRSEGTWSHREMWHIFLECHFYLMAGDLKDYFPPFLLLTCIKDIKMNAKKKKFLELRCREFDASLFLAHDTLSSVVHSKTAPFIHWR